MSTVNIQGFQIDLSPDQQRKVKFLAQQEGMKPEQWLLKQRDKFLKQLFRVSDQLSPKEVANELNCSPDTVKRYYHKGLFPEAILVNARVIRIPRDCLNNFIRQRRVAVA